MPLIKPVTTKALLFTLLCCKLTILQSFSQRGSSGNSFFVGIHGGVNYTLTSPSSGSLILESTSTEENTEISSGGFFGNMGYQFGINAIKMFTDNIGLELAPEIFFLKNTLESTETITGTSTFTVERTAFSSSSYYRFPLTLLYWNQSGRVQPYGYAGISYGFLNTASAGISENVVTTLPDGTNRSTNNSDTRPLSELFITSRFDVVAGIGLYYDFSVFLLGGDVSFNYLLNNTSNSIGRFQNNGTLSATGTGKNNTPAFQLKLILKVNSTGSSGGGGRGRKGKGLDCVYTPKKIR